MFSNTVCKQACVNYTGNVNVVEVRQKSVTMNGVAGGHHDSGPQRSNQPPARPFHRPKMNGDAPHNPRDKKVKVRMLLGIVTTV